MSIDLEHELRECADWLEAHIGLPMRPPAADAESCEAAHDQGSRRGMAWGVRGVAIVCLAAAFAALGVVSSRDGGRRISSVVTVPDSTTSTIAPEIGSLVIPGKVGAADDRDPIQRFIGMPADPVEAAQWARTADGQAFAECMALEAPNQSLDRVGVVTPEQVHCGSVAAARVNILPAMQAEYATLEAQVRSDPKAIRSAALLFECQRAAGFNPTPASPGAADPCAMEQRANSAVLAALYEQYGPAWISENRRALEALRDDIAALVKAASDK